jgi:hypothetical protein
MEVREDPGDGFAIGDESEEAADALAVRAGEDLDEVHAAQEVGPQVTRSRLGASLVR